MQLQCDLKEKARCAKEMKQAWLSDRDRKSEFHTIVGEWLSKYFFMLGL